jgi:hypothetical protein
MAFGAAQKTKGTALRFERHHLLLREHYLVSFRKRYQAPHIDMACGKPFEQSRNVRELERPDGHQTTKAVQL